MAEIVKKKTIKRIKCSICQQLISLGPGGWALGNNAAPVNDGRCCDDCNASVVIPTRMLNMIRAGH